MKIDGTPYRSVWVEPHDRETIRIIDQTRLPWAIDILRLADVREVAHAIRSMQVRGAPLIGATAGRLRRLPLPLRKDPSSSTSAMERDCGAARRDPPDRRQPALGDRTDAHPPCATRGRPGRASASPTRRPARIADEDVAQNASPSAEHGAAADRTRSLPGTPKPAGERADPLQTPAGWPPSTGARRWRRSTPRT